MTEKATRISEAQNFAGVRAERLKTKSSDNEDKKFG